MLNWKKNIKILLYIMCGMSFLFPIHLYSRKFMIDMNDPVIIKYMFLGFFISIIIFALLVFVVVGLANIIGVKSILILPFFAIIIILQSLIARVILNCKFLI